MTQSMTISITGEQTQLRALEREEAAAFESLVRRRTRFVFRVAHALLRNTSDAEDVAQDTFLKLHRSGAWKNMREERAFLARMAWRVALDKKRSHATSEGLRVEVAELDAMSSLDRDPEQLATSGDAIAFVHACIDRLPEDLRQPLVLSAIDELNSREISEVLGVKEGTVRTRLMRARVLLKERLGRQVGGTNER
jgi:RNA polymerase sigma-70 factor (ECF subfamily)